MDSQVLASAKLGVESLCMKCSYPQKSKSSQHIVGCLSMGRIRSSLDGESYIERDQGSYISIEIATIFFGLKEAQ